MGLVSLFSDMTYEGARGMAGPFLFSLGASATAVGLISGLGELIGYGLRMLFGFWSQKTGRYWLFTMLGYGMNLIAVPLLALAGSWPVAAGLLMCERLGKSIRAPSKDVLLSHAASAVGHGKGFGFHEAMDQIGAVSGPLLGALGLFWFGGYGGAFAILAFPAALALVVLTTARFLFPNPSRFEAEPTVARSTDGKFPPSFRIYVAAAALLAFGYADFPLVAYHFRKIGILTDTQIPLAYAAAMGVDAVAALAFGFLFDRMGLKSLPFAAITAGVAVPLAFSSTPSLCWAGIILWGIALGAQESSLKAGIARLVSKERRAGAYGTFHAAFGIAWFGGSAAMGWMYDRDVRGVMALAIGAQVAAAGVFLWAGAKTLK